MLHLVVLQHGLWGRAENLGFLQQLLERKADEETAPVVILNSNVNELYLTYEGADACGDRLVTLIKETCYEYREKGTPITHLSLIGYSMGGLMMRYVAGRLYADGILPNKEAGSAAQGDDKPPIGPLIPVSFVTIATPHLGTWVQPTTWFIRTFNSMVPRVAARSGTQFMLMDKHAFNRPLLVNLTDPELPFMKGLWTFKHHILLANTLHDRTVPYCTAAICEENPYDTHDAVPRDPNYPSIVRPVPRPQPAPRGRPRSRSRTPPPPATRGEAAAAAGSAGAGEYQAVPTAAAAAAVAGSGGTAGVASRSVSPSGGAVVSRRRSLEEWQRLHTKKARKGAAVRVVFLALFPITIPMMCGLIIYMVMVGRKQWRVVRGRSFDHAWVESAAGPARLARGLATAAAPAAPAALAAPSADDHEDDDVPVSAGADDIDVDVVLGGLATNTHPQSIITTLMGNAMSVPQPEVHSVEAVIEEGEGDVKGEGERGSYMQTAVSIDGGARELLLLDGLVDTAGKERETQLWMMRELNKIPWRKIDVDTRHYHAHAAIVLRVPKRFAANADCMQYLVDNLTLDVRTGL